MSDSDPFRAVEIRTAQSIYKYLLHQATLRFDQYGPHDARGAAFWDAACAINPDDHDALGFRA